MIIFLDIGSRGNQNVQDKILQIHILNKAPWHEFSPRLFGAYASLSPTIGKALVMIGTVYQLLLSQVISKSCMFTHLIITL